MQPDSHVTPRKAKAVGYTRVSTDQQADVGLSLEAQAVKIHQVAGLQDAELVDVITDAGVSAKSLDRPALTWLLAQVDAGAVQVVIVAKLDRLTRSLVDLANLLKRFDRRGVALISVAEAVDTGTAIGRMMLNLIVLLSQWERETTAERTRDVLRHKKAKGERVGTLPFGFQLVPGSTTKLEPAPVEQRIVARIRELEAQGCSIRQIADNLNAHGWTTRRGTPWRFEYVARALKVKAS